VRHVVVGTAGHVDHGKTSLVMALTGVQTDRLPEEQRRGITIELGFAPWRIADDVLVSVIDVPGHRRLVHTMIAGASGIDMVLLVVAADEGVMPQTREHVAACKILEVKRAVVAVTKLDRVERDLAELAAEEAVALLATHGIEAEAVLCSAKSGEGLDAVRAAVLAAIKKGAARPERRRRVRLSVDRVFSVHGSGTVVTGTLVEGELAVGAALRVLGPDRDKTASARGLHVHGEARDRAAAPTRLAINLGGLAVEDVERGDVVTDDAHIVPTRVIDAWLDTTEPLERGSEASIYVGTARSGAKVQPVGGDVVAGGGLARLRLNTPLVVLGADRFVLRGARVDGPAGAVVGGGTVLDARPPKNVRAAKRAALLEALHAGDAAKAAAELAAESSPRPFHRAALASRFAIEGPALAAAAEALVAKGELVAADHSGWLTPTALADLEAQAVAAVGEHHRAAPLDPGLKLQTLRERLGAVAGPEACAVVMTRLTSGKKPALVVEKDAVRLPTFKGAAENAAAARALDKAREALRAAALAGLSDNALAQAVGTDSKQVRAISAALVREASALRTGDLYFDTTAVAALRDRVRAHLERAGQLSIQDFKEMTGLGRKQAIPLLELFDRERVTKRQGDLRVKGGA
jgi:selenocysteine-specific elongation factor